MERINVTFTGKAPLLMHSCIGVNPTHPLSIESKKITSKRTKTEEDHEKILEIGFLLALYYDEEVGVFIPATNVEASIREAAKKFKLGKTVVSGLIIPDDMIKLIYQGPKTPQKLFEDYRFKDVRAVNVQRSKVLRCRPRFDRWSINFDLEYDKSLFDRETIENILHTAGLYIGLCDYRPRYGRFEAAIN